MKYSIRKPDNTVRLKDLDPGAKFTSERHPGKVFFRAAGNALDADGETVSVFELPGGAISWKSVHWRVLPERYTVQPHAPVKARDIEIGEFFLDTYGVLFRRTSVCAGVVYNSAAVLAVRHDDGLVYTLDENSTATRVKQVGFVEFEEVY